MSAYELTEEVIKALRTKSFNTMILNYANPDMVGHTGSIPAQQKLLKLLMNV